VRTFLRDTHSHIAQVVELADSAHELSVALLEVYRSSLGQRTNEIMKLLTMIGSIFIPLTFVAGIYGMNFHHMPELRSPWGYPLTLGGMVAVAGGMVLYFRHRGWIGRGRGR
jgi:magnesium transporter